MKRYLRVVAVAAFFDFSLTYATVAADMPVKAPIAPPWHHLPCDWSWSVSRRQLWRLLVQRHNEHRRRGLGSWRDRFRRRAWSSATNWRSENLLLGIDGDFDGSFFNRPPALLPTSLSLVQASASQDWVRADLHGQQTRLSTNLAPLPTDC